MTLLYSLVSDLNTSSGFFPRPSIPFLSISQLTFTTMGNLASLFPSLSLLAYAWVRDSPSSSSPTSRVFHPAGRSGVILIMSSLRLSVEQAYWSDDGRSS
jgi:hypothetical protein